MAARRMGWLLLCLASCACLAFGPPVLTNSDLCRQGLNAQQMRLMRHVPPPEITAPAAIMVNTTTGQVLYARNEHQRRPVASLAKIATAMVALQRGKPERETRVRPEDLVVSSAARLQDNELISLRDLLFMLLIPSDNAAAMTIARTLGGDVRTYVNWMNDLARSWGVNDTRFANPHGLDNKDAYSTAYDMAIIAYRALGDPTFADLVRRNEAVIAGRRLESTNKLLNAYPGILGVKTGTTDKAGECLIAMVERPTGKVLAVVLGSEDRFMDMRLLLDYFYADFAELSAELPQTPQNRYQDEGGAWRELKLQAPMTLLVSPWQVNSASFFRRIDDISSPPPTDKPVGILEVRLADRLLAEVPMYVR